MQGGIVDRIKVKRFGIVSGILIVMLIPYDLTQAAKSAKSTAKAAAKEKSAASSGGGATQDPAPAAAAKVPPGQAKKNGSNAASSPSSLPPGQAKKVSAAIAALVDAANQSGGQATNDSSGQSATPSGQSLPPGQDKKNGSDAQSIADVISSLPPGQAKKIGSEVQSIIDLISSLSPGQAKKIDTSTRPPAPDKKKDPGLASGLGTIAIDPTLPADKAKKDKRDTAAVGVADVQPRCHIEVSGAKSGLLTTAQCEGQGCIPSGSVTVENGNLIFRTVIDDSGAGLEPTAIQWIGGPNANGIMQDPPDQATVVHARVVVASGKEAYCGVKFVQLGQGVTVKVDRYGDCPLFRSIRNYYLLDAANANPQVGGFPVPLSLPGFDAKYGTKQADIPFRGVMNVAADPTGSVNTSNGSVVTPTSGAQKFSAAVIVARTLDTKTMQVGAARYYGVLNPQDYSEVQLQPIDAQAQFSDDQLLVFQLHAAAAQLVNGQDVRGKPGGIPYHSLVDVRGTEPFDYLIPVMNNSCMPIFQLNAPLRADKKTLPSEMRDMKACAFSKPFRFGDFRTGRVRLTAMHFTPERSNTEFPLDLIQANGNIFSLPMPLPSASQTLASPTTPVAFSAAPAASTATTTVATTDPTATLLAAPADVACWKFSAAILGNPTWEAAGDGTTTAPPVIKERVPGDECSLQVNGTVAGTTVGGAGRLGFRYEKRNFVWGLTFSEQVKVSKVGTLIYRNENEPVYYANAYPKEWAQYPFIGTISSGPAATVRTQNFFVRSNGHDSVTLTDTLAAQFTAPICTGSQFKYDNISLSDSPLILDLKGDGIRISRDFRKAVPFDISGTGYQSYIDWPENTDAVAFLALPDAKGEITSIAQLFGDDKAANGYEKLRTLDSNGDGKISTSDKRYSELRLWFDRNRNGVAEASELEALAQQGVKFISLNYAQPGRGLAAEERVLSGHYFNEAKNAFLNVEDQYFYEYVDGARVRFEKRKVQ